MLKSKPRNTQRVWTNSRYKLSCDEAEPVLATTSIQDLPNHLLKRIFSFLDIIQRLRIESVCKKWRLIGKLLPWDNPTKLCFIPDGNHSTINLSRLGTKLNDDILLSLLIRCGASLKELVIVCTDTDRTDLTYRSLECVGDYCPNLESIHLIAHPINNTCLKKIAVRCKNLRKINMHNYDSCNYAIGMLEIIRKCTNLEWLYLVGFWLEPEWFDVVNPKLKSVSIGDCLLSPIALDNLITNCDSIEEIKINLEEGERLEMPEVFKLFYHNRKTLKMLRLSLGASIDETEYICWSKGLGDLHHLVDLHLLAFPSVDDSVIDCIVKECRKIRSLGVPGSNITNRGVTALEALPHLRELDISWNRNIGDKGLKALATVGLLEELNVSFVDNITEEFCCSLAKSLPNLHVLDVSNLKVTNRLVKTFGAAARRKAGKKNLTLIVGQTNVTTWVPTCGGLDVQFATPFDNYFLQKKANDYYKLQYEMSSPLPRQRQRVEDSF